MADMTAAECRQQVRDRMLEMTERLVAEFAGVIPAGSVMRCVSRCWMQLRAEGGVGDVVAAAEIAARRRLTAVLPAHRLA